MYDFAEVYFFKESVETCIHGNMKHSALTGGQQFCKLS